MSAAGERAGRLMRAAQALEARRRAAAGRQAALEAEITALRARILETVDWMTAMAGEARILLSANARLVDLQAQARRLEAERDAARRAAQRDRRMARGAEKAAARHDAQARREAARAELDALLDLFAARPGGAGD